MFDFKIVVLAVAFIIFDILSGGIGHMILGDYESNKMRSGGKKKLFSVMAIALGMMLDIGQIIAGEFLGFEAVIPFTSLICVYLIWMEVMSIMENIDAVNPHLLPPLVRNMLKSHAEESGVETKE